MPLICSTKPNHCRPLTCSPNISTPAITMTMSFKMPVTMNVIAVLCFMKNQITRFSEKATTQFRHSRGQYALKPWPISHQTIWGVTTSPVFLSTP